MSNNSTLGSFDSPLSPDDAMTDFLTGGGKASNTDEGYRNLPLTEKIRIQIKEAADAHRPWSTQAHEAQRFVAGHQWEEDQVRQLQELGKPKITYNYIAPLINGLVGYESQNRQQMLFTPRLPEHLLSEQYDVSAADAVDTASAGVRWAMARCHGNHERSLVFRDLAVTGMGWASHSMEYEDDLDGKYVYERIPGDQMLWDPRSRKQNLEDAAWVARVSAYHIDEIEERWGKKKRQEVLSTRRNEESSSVVGGLVGDMHGPTTIVNHSPNIYDAGAQEVNAAPRSPMGSSKGYIPVVDYQWRERYPITRVFLNDENQTVLNLDKKDFAEWKKNNPDAPVEKILKASKYRYKRIHVTGGVQLDDEADVFLFKSFTYKCVTGYWDNNDNSWYGLLRSMLDPQKGINKYFALAVYLMSVSPKGLVLVEESAIANPAKLAQDLARPGALVRLRDKAISENKIKVEPGPAIPDALTKLLEISMQALYAAGGIPAELATQSGTGDMPSDLPDKLDKSMHSLGMFLDAYKRYRESETMLCLDFLRFFMPTGRWIRVGGPGSEQHLQLLEGPLSVEFDLEMDDVPVDPSHKKQVWAILQPIMPMLLRMDLVGPELLKLAPVPKSVIDGMIKEWKAKQEQNKGQPQEPTKKDQDPEYIKSETALNESQSALNHARAEAISAETDLASAKTAQEILMADEDRKMGRDGKTPNVSFEQKSMNDRSTTAKGPGVRSNTNQQ